MTLHLADIPDRDDDLDPWLERVIVGPELVELCDELHILGGDRREPSPSLEQALTVELLEAVLRNGLAAVPASSLRRLLSSPPALLALQRRIFEAGTSYWEPRLPAAPTAESAEESAAVWERIVGQAARPAVEPSSAAGRGRVRFYALAAVAAALVAVALPFWNRDAENQQAGPPAPPQIVPGPNPSGLRPEPPPRPPDAIPIPTPPIRPLPPNDAHPPSSLAWGWNRPDLLVADVSSAAYLERLGIATRGALAQPANNARQVAQVIDGMLAGCERLLAAEHVALNVEDDRTWLKTNCERWRVLLQQRQQDLKDGQPHPTVYAAFQRALSQMEQALYERARLRT